MPKYLLALDQGTTSSRAILFDLAGKIVSSAQYEFRQIYPGAGYVEHDPFDILETQKQAAADVLKRAEIQPGDIAAIGVTNQRETTIVWDRRTGRPLHNAIVWQDTRTDAIAAALDRPAPVLDAGPGPGLDLVDLLGGEVEDVYYAPHFAPPIQLSSEGLLRNAIRRFTSSGFIYPS